MVIPVTQAVSISCRIRAVSACGVIVVLLSRLMDCVKPVIVRRHMSSRDDTVFIGDKIFYRSKQKHAEYGEH